MITSPSGKSYIGQTMNFEKRMREHNRPSSPCVAIRDCILRFGFDKMKVEILLKDLTLDEANKYEEFYIKEHNTLVPNGYNLREGGENRALSDEVKRKIGEGNRGKVKSPETIELHRNAMKGRKMSDEFKRKISEALKGKPKSEEHKEKTRQVHIGMKHTEESKLKISMNRKGIKISKEAAIKQLEAYRNTYNKKEYPFYLENIASLPDDTLFTTKELYKLLGIGQPCTLTSRIRNGMFPNVVVDSKKGGKVYYIPIQDVHDYYKNTAIIYSDNGIDVLTSGES
jgi:group I intron endonuclease